MASSDRIQAFIDKQDVQEVTARYARAVDWLDIPGMKACFHPDSKVRFLTSEVGGHEFCDFWGDLARSFKMRHHHFAYPVVELQGENKAFVEISAMYGGTYNNNGAGRLRDFLEGGRYHWHMERRDEVWRVSEARIFLIWSQGQPTPASSELGGTIEHDLDTSNPLFVPLPVRS